MRAGSPNVIAIIFTSVAAALVGDALLDPARRKRIRRRLRARRRRRRLRSIPATVPSVSPELAGAEAEMRHMEAIANSHWKGARDTAMEAWGAGYLAKAKATQRDLDEVRARVHRLRGS